MKTIEISISQEDYDHLDREDIKSVRLGEHKFLRKDYVENMLVKFYKDMTEGKVVIETSKYDHLLSCQNELTRMKLPITKNILYKTDGENN